VGAVHLAHSAPAEQGFHVEGTDTAAGERDARFGPCLSGVVRCTSADKIHEAGGIDGLVKEPLHVPQQLVVVLTRIGEE
jgi:hypothetical protein